MRSKSEGVAIVTLIQDLEMLLLKAYKGLNRYFSCMDELKITPRLRKIFGSPKIMDRRNLNDPIPLFVSEKY